MTTKHPCIFMENSFVGESLPAEWQITTVNQKHLFIWNIYYVQYEKNIGT